MGILFPSLRRLRALLRKKNPTPLEKLLLLFKLFIAFLEKLPTLSFLENPNFTPPSSKIP
jgi:hypothetical protein